MVSSHLGHLPDSIQLCVKLFPIRESPWSPAYHRP